MEITEEQRKKLAHAWRTIALIVRKHRDQFDPNEWAMLARASLELRIIGDDDKTTEWPATDFEKWEAMK